MSDTGKPGREWRFYVDDMRKFAQKVLAYTQGASKNSWTVASPMMPLCGIWSLLARRPPTFPMAWRQAHPEIPWRLIQGDA